MFTIILDGQHATISPAIVWTSVIISLAISLAFYLLRSFGLYAMAKKKELSHAFIAFIPCVWIFTACKLIGKVKCFGSTFERLALLFAIALAVGQGLNFIYNFLIYFPVAGNFLAGREMFLVMVTDTTVGVDAYTQGMVHLSGDIYGYGLVNPYVRLGISQNTIDVILNIIYYVSTLTDIAVLVVTITLYVSLFRAYVPQHYILFSVLSVFLGIFAPLVFAIRKKDSIDYNDYLRQRYNAWYSNGSYYGGPVNNGAPQAPSTPFEEFAENGEIDPGDPFENLSGNGDKKENDKNDKDEFFN